MELQREHHTHARQGERDLGIRMILQSVLELLVQKPDPLTCREQLDRELTHDLSDDHLTGHTDPLLHRRSVRCLRERASEFLP